MHAPSLALVLLFVASTGLACASVEAVRLERSGRAALDRGDAARAVADLERAATLVPGASAIQNHLGIAYEQAGRREDAERAYARAVALDCENEAAASNLEALRGAQARATLPP